MLEKQAWDWTRGCFTTAPGKIDGIVVFATLIGDTGALGL